LKPTQASHAQASHAQASHAQANEASQANEATAQANGGPRVVAIGGGHGLASTLRAARSYAGELTAIVSVADDGGSSGRLRQGLGIPAPGDLRKCLVALADPGSLWARTFEHRFEAGELEGHAVGNLIIAGLAEQSGDFTQALHQASQLLGVSARVLPATSEPVVLCAEVAGEAVVGQVNVAAARDAISSVCLVPSDPAVPEEVIAAVEEADQVVIGPGSLFTSVLAACAVPTLREALQRRTGGRVYVCNLRPQLPETAGFSAADHLRALAAHRVPVDVMLVDVGALTARDHCLQDHCLEDQYLEGVKVVTAAVGRADLSAHDPERLASALTALAAPELDRSGGIG